MRLPHLVWVSSTSLYSKLDAATLLSITRDLRSMGWQVTLIAVGPVGFQSIRGVEVLCLPSPDIYILRHLIFFIRAIAFLINSWNKIDIILFQELGAPWLIPLRFFRVLSGRRKPLFVMDTRSAYMADPNKETAKDRLRRLFLASVHRLGSYFVDGRLTITRRMAEYVRIPAEKLWGVWPSGVDIQDFEKASSIRQWPKSNQAIKLIYIGYLGEGRNIMGACRAVMQANSLGMNYTFSIYGKGEDRSELEEFSQKTSGAVQVNPPVPHEEVERILAQAHIGVIPFPNEPKFQVSSPLKLFEYMASGLPVMATRIVCLTDAIGDAKFVFWAETSEVNSFVDALRIIWQSRDSLKELGMQAVVAAQDWTWTASARKMKVALEKGLERFG